jgi:flavin-dependent dehydrogenase
VERADVLIVGGGPAGSSCAAALGAAGRDVLVLDGRPFPRDKPCAGWITPEVVARLGLRLEEYGAAHTLQPISRFRVGRIGGRAVDVDYGAPVSHAIRRCELDAWLLGRSGARMRLGERAVDVRREGSDWRVNGRFAAPVLVGAGGHFCPVARLLNGDPPRQTTVVAREAEFLLEGKSLAACRVDPERPELYFCGDLQGYGWCVRKGSYLNVGLGRRDPRALPEHVAAFLDWLVREGRVGAVPRTGWHGHAYLLREGAPRRLSGDGVLLAGDAAGLAFPESGEGILPAVVSGQLAAEAILEARGAVEESRLGARYAARLAGELGPPRRASRAPGVLATAAGAVLLSSTWFTRRVVLDRWFLHRRSGGRRGAGMAPGLEGRSASLS